MRLTARRRRTAAGPAVAADRAIRVVFSVHGLVFASWVAHIPHVKAALGLSNAGLGLALLGGPVGSVVATLVCGPLLASLGSARVVRWALLGYSLAGIGVGVAGSAFTLALALAVWGMFQGTLDVAMNTQGITVEHAIGRPIMSGLHARWSIGSFAGAALGALAVAAGVSLTAQLLVLGPTAGAIAGLGCRHLLRDPVASASHANRRLLAALRHRIVLILGVIGLAAMLCEGAAADWSAVYLRTTLGLSPGLAGAGYAVFSAAMVSVRLAGDRLLLLYPARVLLPALAAIATVGMALALALGTPPAALAGLATLGLGLGLVVPVAFSAAGRLTAIPTGSAIAAVSAIGWIGFVGGPPLIGRVADLVTLPAALALVPVMTAAIAALALGTDAFPDPKR